MSLQPFSFLVPMLETVLNHGYDIGLDASQENNPTKELYFHVQSNMFAA